MRTGSARAGVSLGQWQRRRGNRRPTWRLRPMVALVLGTLGAGRAQATMVGNVIVPDGRTATTLAVHGSVTDIHTRTVSGANAFNAFSRFSVAAGRTVNLDLPSGTQNLINIVTGAPTQVDGIINSISQGHIGGHVFFADPYGLVVGQSGAMNVGSLTVTTPTHAFLDALVSRTGVVNQADTAALLAGRAPQSPDGVIIIDGKIRALDAVDLRAGIVRYAGTATVGADAAGTIFRHVVNVEGLQHATGLTEDQGQIVITGGQQAVISGTLDAGGTHGGTIAVTAPKVDLTSTARLQASGPLGGGTIRVGALADGTIAADTVTMARGATLNANAETTGQGGTVTVVSHDGTRFEGTINAQGGAQSGNGGQVEVSATRGLYFEGTVNTDAPHGFSGDLLLDPTDLYVADSNTTGSSNTITVGQLQAEGNTNITLTASNQLTVGSSNGGAANVDLTQLLSGSTLTLDAGTGTSGAGNIVFNSGSSIETGGGGVAINAGTGFSGATATSSGGLVTLGAITAPGAAITVQAAQEITVPTGATLTSSANAAGAISLTAPEITVQSGSTIAAVSATAGTATGIVTLDAASTQTAASGPVSTSSGITLDGGISADAIDAETTASSVSSYSGDGATGYATVAGSALLSGQGPGFSLYYVQADASAGLTVGGTAMLDSPVISLTAQATETAKSLDFAGLLASGMVLPTTYGNVTGTASVAIMGGATIDATQSLTVAAHNTDTLSASAIALTTRGATKGAGAVAIGIADVNTTAVIHSGAQISGGGTVTIAADNQNSLSTSATAMANNAGMAGIGVSVADYNVNANASDGADLGSSADPVGNVLVQALNTTTADTNAASASAGSSFILKYAFKGLNAVGGSLSGFAGSLSGSELGAVSSETPSASAPDGGSATSGGTSVPFKVAGAMAFTTSSITADATIGADPTVTAAAAPVVDSSGTVNVVANTTTTGVRNNASAAVNSETTESAGTATNPASSVSIAAGIAIGFFANTAHATIGNGTTINATHIGVGSVASLPISVTWWPSTWTSPSALLSNILGKANGTLGAYTQAITSGALATSQSTKAQVAGAIDWFQTNNSSLAFIGDGATLTASGDAGTWKTTGYSATANALTWNWNNTVAVEASGIAQSIDAGGNVGLTFFGTQGGSQASAGGAFQGVWYQDSTVAGIGNATVDVANGGVDVNAGSQDTVIALLPSAGSGSGIGLSGAISFINLDETTHASVSNGARLTVGGDLSVNAVQALQLLNIAGSVQLSNSAGVGVGIAVNSVKTDTQAYIGNNAMDDPSTTQPTLTGGGLIQAGAVAVTATSDGQMLALSVSAAKASGSNSQSSSGGTGGGSNSSPTDDVMNIPADIAAIDSNLTGNATTDATSDSDAETGTNALSSGQGGSSTTAGSGGTPAPKFGLSVAGSASVNVTNVSTQAYIDGADVVLPALAATGNGRLTIQALNETATVAVSGGGALTLAGQGSSSWSAAVTAALAINILGNTTTASLADSTVTQVQQAAITAATGGQAVSVALGVAANTNTNSASGEGAGSVSLTLAQSTVSATDTNSTLSGLAAASTAPSLAITAYDETDIGDGGGAFFGGGKVGVGVAFSFNKVANTLTAALTGGDVTGMGSVSVQALDATQILTMALVGGGSSGSSGFTGAASLAINDVGNTDSAGITGGAVVTSGTVTVSAQSGGTNSALTTLLTQGASGAPSATDTGMSFSFTGSPLPAFSGSAIVAIAGNILVSGNNVGLSVVYNTIHSHYDATIADSTVTTRGAVDVTANDQANIIGLAVGGGVSTGNFAGVGSITVNQIADTAAATIGNPQDTSNLTTVSAGSLDESATNGGGIWSLAGNIAYSKGVAAGAAVSYNSINNTTSAAVDEAQVTMAGDATQTASNSAAVDTLAAAGVGSQGVALGGAISANVLTNTTTVAVANSGIGAAAWTAQALDNADIGAISGDAAVSTGGVAVGIGLSVNTIGDTTTATLASSTLAVPAATAAFTAANTSTIQAIAAGGAVSTSSVAVGGANTDNIITNTTAASATDVAGSIGGLTIGATDGSTIQSLAGELAGGSDVGVGGAVSVNSIENSVTASLGGTLAVQGTALVDVSAQATGTIQSLGAVGSLGGEGAGAGAATGNNIGTTVSAGLNTLTVSDSNATIAVNAQNTATIEAAAVGAAGSGTAAVGVGVAVNRIGGTTHAYVHGGTLNIRDLTVGAVTTNGIATIAAGVAVSGEVSAAGSLATDVLTGTTTADIDEGAQVVAFNNVGVTASDANIISAASGALAIGAGAAGIGLGVTVNVLNDSTNAFIGDTGTTPTSVTAEAQGSSLLTVANGALTTVPGVQNLQTYSGYVAPVLTEGTMTVHGLAVNAESRNAVSGLATSVSLAFDPAGSAAVNADAVTNVIGGTTRAYAENALLNQNGTAGSGQSVSIMASRHDFGANLVFGAAAGATDVAASAALGVNTFNGTTSAYLMSDTTSAAEGVTVAARSSQDSLGLAAGLSGGIVGVAGTGLINLFTDTTQAYVAGGQVSGGGLSVSAQSRAAEGLVTGTISGGAVGVAATVLVVDGNDSTQAWVGQAGLTTAINVTQAMVVNATSATNLWTLAVSGAVGAGAGFAGQVAVLVLHNTTTATVQDATVVAPAVTVAAADNTAINAYAGALAGGESAGVGIGANVVVLGDTVGAAVNDSQLTTGALAVQAQATQAITLVTATAGLSGGYSGAGAVGLILAGSSNGGAALTALKSSGSLRTASAVGTGGNSAGGDSSLSNTEQTGVSQATTFNAGTAATSIIPDATTAMITGGTVQAGTVTVSATESTSTSNIAGAGAGGVVGTGAGVAVTIINDTVGAAVTGAHVSANSLAVTALAQDGSNGAAVSTQAYAGVGGAIFGLGAAIGVGTIGNTVTATVGGAVNTTGALTVSADDGQSVSSTGIGAAVGAGAVGVVVGDATRQSTVEATLGGRVSAASVAVTAQANGAAGASVTGAAAGIVSGTGAAATATDADIVTADVAPATTVSGLQGGVTVQATDTPAASANAVGVAVSATVGLGLSIAIAQVTPIVTADIGSGATLSGTGGVTIIALVAPANGGTGASATAIAGTGGLLVGAGAATAQATDGATVEAYTGTLQGSNSTLTAVNGMVLPNGPITVSANNTSRQQANATGVTAGALAVGASVATAQSTATTFAGLGSGTTTTAQSGSNAGTGTIAVLATGNDTNNASATAGSGGIIAGDAAVANTDDNAVTIATIGANSHLRAYGAVNPSTDALTGGAMTVSATHTSAYFGSADSVNAAAASASGAFANNTVTNTTAADIGTGATLQAMGTITITAANTTSEDNRGNDSVNAGAGGLLNGTAAVSETSITESAVAHIAADSRLVSGLDPFLNPGQILVTADNVLTSKDQAILNSGGAIEGAGVNSTTTVNETNAVTVGNGAYFFSYGTIGLGTYSLDAVGNAAYAHTWGLAGVAVADATSQVDANQSVTLGTNVSMLGYGSVTLSAGQSGDGLWTTDIAPDAIAQSYVRALIAIPAADASAPVTGSSTLTTGSGDAIDSGRNIYLFAYRGTDSPQANGTGHGYELGFIPVTDGSSNPSVSVTSVASLNGTAVGGWFHDQSLIIGANGGITSASGAPIMVTFDSAFNPQGFLSDLSTSQVANGDGSVAIGLLKSYVSQSAVTAAELSPLYAAAGNVTVHAASINGGATLTAYGAPQITVENNSPDYLLVDGAYIPAAGGGNVYFTGGVAAANATAAGITVNAIDAGGTPAISIAENYNSAVGSDDNGEGPAIFLTGPIEGLTSDVTISNADGSFGEFGTITALEQIIDIPNGAFVTYLPGKTYHSGTSPESAWYNYLTNTVLPQTPDQAVVDIVNATYNANGSNNSSNSLTHTVLWQAGTNTGFDDTYDQSKDTPDGTNSTTSTDYDYIGGTSDIYFGSCIAAVSGGCSNGAPAAASPVDQAYGGGPGGGSGYDYPLIPTATLTYTQSSYSDANLSGATGSVTNSGGPIGIVAKYIDLNSTITSGQPTDWSVSLPSALDTTLTAYTVEYDTLRSLGFNDLSSTITLPSAVVNTGDQPITATYNVLTNQITLNAVHAAGGGFVMLDGGIISTDPNGGVSINDGYGQVVVNNQTTAPVVVNNIDTGTGAIGEVKIIDTLQPANLNHWWYLYKQGVGLSVYNNRNGYDTLSQAQLVSSTTGDSATYDPVSGLRYQWTETVNVERSYTGGPSYSAGNWSWANANYSPTQTAQWVVSPGALITGSSDTNAFTATLTGSASAIASQQVVYHGCSGDSDCNFGFPEWWQYNIIGEGTLTATSSVYASNPIAISFNNSARALVSVTSPAGVVLDGEILNPDGLTAIAASNGDITQANTATLSTASLLLAADGDIGTAAQPLVATLGNTGYLSAASSNGAIHLTLGSAVNITGDTVTPATLAAPYSSADITASDFGPAVTAAGNVDISATGAINDEVGSYVIGSNINLISVDAGIGSATAPLDILATGTANGAGGVIGGLVNANAALTIGLSSPYGNLVIGSIVSDAGDVYLTSGGGIFDARAETPADTLSQTQMKTVWTSLNTLEKPTTTSGEAAFTSAVDQTSTSSFESLAQANFAAYERLVNPEIGAVQGGTLTLTQAGTALFTPLAAAAGMTPAAYAQGQYTSLTGFFASNFGSQWASVLAPIAQGTSLWANFWAANSNPTTATDTTLANQLGAMTAHAGWTADELTYELDNQALAAGTGTLVGTTTPNVAGHNVSLIAGGSIGTVATPVTVTAAEILGGTLTSAQAAALALATLPGEVSSQTVNGALQFTITQTAPLFVNATGTFTAHSPGNIYIQSAGALALDGVAAGGSAVLAASQDITSTVAPGAAVVTTGGNLALTAGTGSIGSATTPLAVNVGGNLSAAAGDSLYLTELNGNLTLSQVSAINTVVLNAPTGSLLSLGLPGLTNVDGDTVTLTAQGDIGQPTAFLTAQTGSGGLTATAGGFIGLDAPLPPNALTATFTLDTVTAGGPLDVVTGENLVADTLSSVGNLTITGTGSGTIHSAATQAALTMRTTGNLTAGTVRAGTTADLTSGGNMSVGSGTSGGSQTLISGGNLDYTTLDAGNDVTIDSVGTVAGQSLLATGNIGMTAGALDMPVGGTIQGGGIVGVTTNGNIILGSLTSTLDPSIATIDVDLAAGGAITSNAGAVTNITALSPGSETELAAGRGIGTLTVPLVVDLPWLDATTTSGPLVIRDLMGLDAPVLTATAGAIEVSADGPLTVGTVTAGTTADLTSEGAFIGTDVTAGGNAEISAWGSAGALQLANFSADNGLLQTSGNMTLGTATTADTLTLIAANVYAQDITTGGLLSVTANAPAGIIDLQTVNAPEVAFATRGTLTVESLTLQNSGQFAANVMTLGIHHPYDNTLVLAATGFDNGVARRITLGVDSIGPVAFSRLFARNAVINVAANPVTIADGEITDTLTMWTPQRSLYMNNIDPALENFGIQLYQPSTFFMLGEFGAHTVTNAYVVNYGFNVDGTVNDYIGSHIGLAPDFTGSSGVHSGGLANLGLIGANHGVVWRDLWARWTAPPLPPHRGRRIRVIGSGVDWRRQWGL
ncbi:MAG: leukotoxin LktA family filamentous adhesin [Acidiferrobacter sp.]